MLLFLLAFRPLLVLGAQDRAPKEYEIKSAYLYNFARFVEWPAAAFEVERSPLLIGLLGEDPFGGVLEQTLDNRAVRGRRVMARPLRTLDEARKCQIVFLNYAEPRLLRGWLQQLRLLPVLTIGDSADFCRLGGAIGFVEDNGSIRFEVNLEAAHQAGLVLSSQLLQVAREVLRPGQE